MSLLERLSRFWWLWLIAWLFVATLIFQVGPYPALSNALESPFPEETPGMSGEQLYDFLIELSDQSALYMWFQVLDTVQVGLMALAMTLLFYQAFVVRWPQLKGWLFVPLVVAVSLHLGFDWLENALLGLAASGNFDQSPLLAMPGIVTAVKLVVASITLVATFATVIALVTSYLRARFRPGKHQ